MKGRLTVGHFGSVAEYQNYLEGFHGCKVGFGMWEGEKAVAYWEERDPGPVIGVRLKRSQYLAAGGKDVGTHEELLGAMLSLAVSMTRVDQPLAEFVVRAMEEVAA